LVEELHLDRHRFLPYFTIEQAWDEVIFVPRVGRVCPHFPDSPGGLRWILAPRVYVR